MDFLINAGSVADGQWSFYSLSENRITLATDHIASEQIVYHEMGHHIHLAILQDGKRQTGKGGTHTLVNNNASPNQTIIEGFANGYESMVDSRYFLDDNEANERIHGIGWLESTTHPFVAEIRYSSFLVDLFDGVDKFESFGIDFSNIPSFIILIAKNSQNIF